jgi:lipoprotein NlpI/transglutaminase-like putative cysteine protease
MISKFWPVLALALSLAAPLGRAQAQTPPAKAAPAKSSTRTGYPVVPAGAGYRFGPAPAWVKPLPESSASATKPAAPGAKARREALVDIQTQLAPRSATATWIHLQHVALDTSTLREVSEPQISFNPAYQQLVIHQLGVIRDGRREDRLKDARIELMRREQQLERQMIDGVRTALVVLRDVRVGDVVDVAYTLQGENPIFEGRFAALLPVAGDVPIDRLHVRIEGPAERRLQVRGIATELQPERFEEGGRQVLRIWREQVAPVVEESATPPWFKVYPALHFSEYASWADVNQWARGLFAPEPANAALAERIAAIKAEGGTPEQQAAAALRFVQDEVRYFSASLGESSHRPKPASRTLAERLGDCKDKVVLLNALLSGLGLDARPVLVSVQRNRGVPNFLPSHDVFDHVISRVQIGEQAYYLDPTLNGQGLSLDKRGYFPYGAGLVIGPGTEAPVAIVPPAFAVDALSFRQDWDLSDLKQPARLRTSFKAAGLAAERWRAMVAQAGSDRLAESIGGQYVKAVPGLVSVGTPELLDDRAANEIELRLSFEHPAPGQYQRGMLELELPAIELADAMALPPEARRRQPFMLDGARHMELRVAVTGPRPFSAQPPAPQQVSDKHFSFQARVENQGGSLVALSRYERRADEVLPADLDTYRERIGRARQLSGSRARLALIDFRDKGLDSQFTAIDRRLARFSAGRPDALLQILQANEVTRLAGSQLLAQLDPASRLAARVLAERAQAANLLGDFAAGLVDAEAALQAQPPAEEAAAALEAKGVALVGLARPAEALAAFQRQGELDSSNPPGAWLGTAHFMLGDYALAEAALRDSAASASGEARHFTLLWLYLAAERQGGRGKAAIADEVANVDTGRDEWGGQLLRYLGGALDRDALLKAAKAKPEQERLRLAEAYFFIGQQLAAQGKRGEALPWFERTVATQAVPYREFTLAQWELKRGSGS